MSGASTSQPTEPDGSPPRRHRPIRGCSGRLRACMDFVNLTPHAIRISLSCSAMEIQPSGIVARVDERDSDAQEILQDPHVGPGDYVLIVKKQYMAPVFAFAPDGWSPAPGAHYLVSTLAREACQRMYPESHWYTPDSGRTAIRAGIDPDIEDALATIAESAQFASKGYDVSGPALARAHSILQKAALGQQGQIRAVTQLIR